MKKTKTQKGITLIALIITIVVLLILAVVAIRAVTGDGIIAKAKESASKYSDAQVEENLKLLEYELQLAESSGGSTSDLVTNLESQDWVESVEQTNGITKVVAKNGKIYGITSTGTIVDGESVVYQVLAANSVTAYQESFATASSATVQATSGITEGMATTLALAKDVEVKTVTDTTTTTEFAKGLVEYDDGTTYYVGNVNNNYVWFGGFKWRIVNINADGSIKLVTEQQLTQVVAGPKDNSYGSLKDNYIGKWLTEEFLANFSRADDLLTVDYSTPDLTSSESTWNSKVSLLTTEDCLRSGIYEHPTYTKCYNNKQYYPYKGLESSYLLGDGGNSFMSMLANSAYYGSHTPDRIRMRYLANDSASGDSIQQVALSDSDKGIRPVITISKDMILNTGDGTLTNPYTIRGESVATKVADINVGEYVQLENGDKARVMAKDDTGVKFILTRNLTTTKIFNKTTNVFSTDSEGYTALTQYFKGTLTTDSSYENKVDITGYLDTNTHKWYVGGYVRGQDYNVTKDTKSDYTGSYAIVRVGEMFASFLTRYQFTMTPSTTSATMVFITNHGLQEIGSVGHAIRPAFYLKTDLKVTSGNGQYNNPYVLETLS